MLLVSVAGRTMAEPSALSNRRIIQTAMPPLRHQRDDDFLTRQRSFKMGGSGDQSWQCGGVIRLKGWAVSVAVAKRDLLAQIAAPVPAGAQVGET
jgi:hypothetical protein